MVDAYKEEGKTEGIEGELDLGILKIRKKVERHYTRLPQVKRERFLVKPKYDEKLSRLLEIEPRPSRRRRARYIRMNDGSLVRLTA